MWTSSSIALTFGAAARAGKPEDDFSELEELTKGVNNPDPAAREAFLFANLNIPRIINEMAAQTALLQQVCSPLHANYSGSVALCAYRCLLLRGRAVF